MWICCPANAIGCTYLCDCSGLLRQEGVGMVHLHRVLFNLTESKDVGYLVGEMPNNVEGFRSE